MEPNNNINNGGNTAGSIPFYPISSLLSDGNPPGSSQVLEAPSIAQLADSPYIPSSLSNLGVAFSSSALPATSVAQRRSRAPPITVAEQPKVARDAFDQYLLQVKEEWDRWEREEQASQSRKRRRTQSANPHHQPPLASTSHLSLSSSDGLNGQNGAEFSTEPDAHDRARDLGEQAGESGSPSPRTDNDGGGASDSQESLPPLSGVPQIFFDPSFNLSNPRTFDLVTERIQLSPSSSPRIGGPSSSSSPFLNNNNNNNNNNISNKIAGTGTFSSNISDDEHQDRDPGSPRPPADALSDPASSSPLPGLGPLTLADLASDQILQEKLSHYTAIIESHLVREIGLRSSSFFAALSNLQSLQQQGSNCLDKISELQEALRDAEGKVGVGGAAKKGLGILRSQARRRGLEKVDKGVRVVREVAEALEQARGLVEMGRWMDALEVVDEVEEMYWSSNTSTTTNGSLAGSSMTNGDSSISIATNGDTSPKHFSLSTPTVMFTPTPSSSSSVDPLTPLHLPRLSALKSLPKKLLLLRSQIARSLEAELVAVLENSTERAVKDYRSCHGQGGQWRDEARERAKERVRPVVMGLVRAEGMEVAVATWRESVLKEVRGMVREHLPTGDNDASPQGAGEEEDALGIIVSGRTSLELNSNSSISEKSVSLAKRLRAMPHASFLQLAEDTYLGLLGTIEAVDLHSKVLLDLVAESKLKIRPSPLLASSLASTALSAPPNTSSTLTVPGLLPPSSNPLSPAPASASSPVSSTPTTIPLPSPSSAASEETPLSTDLSDVVHAAAELANLRFSKVIGVRTDAHSQLSLTSFIEIFDLSWFFVVQCEVICRRMIVGLRGVMVGQAKTWLQAFHQKRLQESAKRVEEELWTTVEVGAKTQRVVARILNCAVGDPEELLLGKRREVKGLFLDVGEHQSVVEIEKLKEGDKEDLNKQLEVEGRDYFAVAAGIAAVEVLQDYLMVIINCPLLTTDAMSKVVEFLKSFNSRTCQVVLGAGAMRSAGLKNITAKHLALASQALSVMIALIPYVRETVRRHLNPKQAVMLVEFDKLRRDYQEHQNEIHSKLVAIMSDRLQIHCKTLEGINWEETITSRKEDQPNAYMEALVKEHTTLHKVLSRFLQPSTLEYIMAQVFSALNAKLAEEFGAVQLKSEDARKRMLVDVGFMKAKLAELKGLERETPGGELEQLVQSKPNLNPPPPRPIVSRTSTSDRPSLTNSAPLPPPPTPAPSQIDSSAPLITPIVVPAATASNDVPTSPSVSVPVAAAPNTTPAPPPKRKSMAERLAELARRRPSAAELASHHDPPPTTPSSSLETVPIPPLQPVETSLPVIPETLTADSGEIPQGKVAKVEEATPVSGKPLVEEPLSVALVAPLPEEIPEEQPPTLSIPTGSLSQSDQSVPSLRESSVMNLESRTVEDPQTLDNKLSAETSEDSSPLATTFDPPTESSDTEPLSKVRPKRVEAEVPKGDKEEARDLVDGEDPLDVLVVPVGPASGGSLDVAGPNDDRKEFPPLDPSGLELSPPHSSPLAPSLLQSSPLQPSPPPVDELALETAAVGPTSINKVLDQERTSETAMKEVHDPLEHDGGDTAVSDDENEVPETVRETTEPVGLVDELDEEEGSFL